MPRVQQQVPLARSPIGLAIPARSERSRQARRRADAQQSTVSPRLVAPPVPVQATRIAAGSAALSWRSALVAALASQAAPLLRPRMARALWC
jgi:hypothetical protein